LEQVRPDHLDAAWSQLAPGGLRRLLERGAFFPDCRHLASSFSASTLATLATGAWPAQHGIVSDRWYDRVAHAPVSASDEYLEATTLAAQVADASFTRVYVASMNAAHAGLFAGTPDAHLYWMDERGQFATAGEAPDWFAPFAAQKSPDTFRNEKWTAIGARPDAPPLRVLTYDPERPGEFPALYRSSPLAQGALFDLAEEMIRREQLGQKNFDLLCVLVSSTALLGYETGAQNPLMQQMLLQFDRRIELLLTQLNRAPGENNYSVILAGGHGAPLEPSADLRPRLAVSSEAVAQAVDRNLSAAGMGRVEKYVYPFLYLDTSGFRDPEPLRLAAGSAALQSRPVANYFTAGGACSIHDQWERRFRNSFHWGRSGDVMLSYRPGHIEDTGLGRGISYGSLYNYDVRVPLCFYGPQFRAGVFETPVESVDFAPTLARAMGVAAPSSSVGRVLGEAFAP
jgi:arylsulfatase A-like enzyme